jgi:hypothetical protein
MDPAHDLSAEMRTHRNIKVPGPDSSESGAFAMDTVEFTCGLTDLHRLKSGRRGSLGMEFGTRAPYEAGYLPTSAEGEA